MGEHLGDAGGHEQRLVEDLAPGEAQDRVPARLEVGVAGAVVLERGAVAVGRLAVGLDQDAAVEPREVDHVAADRVVDLGLGQAGLTHQAEHAAFELACGAQVACASRGGGGLGGSVSRAGGS